MKAFVRGHIQTGANAKINEIVLLDNWNEGRAALGPAQVDVPELICVPDDNVLLGLLRYHRVVQKIVAVLHLFHRCYRIQVLNSVCRRPNLFRLTEFADAVVIVGAHQLSWLWKIA